MSADIVIVSSYPADIDWWQGEKGLIAAYFAVKEGGVIVFCTPCPEGVAIPDIFQMLQWHTAFDLKEPARSRYNGLGKGWQEKQKPATACKECGKCEEKCPQKIAIQEKLKEAHAVLAEKGKAGSGGA